MDFILSLCIGIGLSAACGYRVFVPLLGMNIAAGTGHVSLPPELQWISSYEAFAAFAVATVLEIGAYYIPLIDNALDTVAAPAAVVAGTLVMSSFMSDLSPFLKWSLALIAGGGTAGIFQASTTLVRSTSTVTTAGLGNFAVTSVETGMSILLTLLAFLLPFIAALTVLGIILFVLRVFFRKRSPGRY